jgi:aryl-alcohol dehydrogenase-like predicted oxidoreductase
MPRFQDEALGANAQIASRVQQVAARLGATPDQVALAWIHAQARRLRIPVLTIPGTRRPQRLEENTGALDLELDQAAFDTLDPLADNVQGARY